MREQGVSKTIRATIYCRERVLEAATPARNDTSSEITIRGKKNQKKAAAKTIGDHFFLQFNAGPQRECLYVKNIQ